MDMVCSTNGERRNAYRISVDKPEGKRSLGRPRRRWENIIKMDRRKVECGVIICVGLTQNRGQCKALCIR
jgi:hypothetical protein